MPVGDEDHGSIALSETALARVGDQLVEFGLGEKVAFAALVHIDNTGRRRSRFSTFDTSPLGESLDDHLKPGDLLRFIAHL